MHADESTQWERLHAHYDTKRINHSVAYSKDGACTNWAESYFARLRRSEIGTHHRIAGPYLHEYSDEMAWRENNRRLPNGSQYELIAGAAITRPTSRNWVGYWQRGKTWKTNTQLPV
jgi:hypothetical protein